MHTCAPLCACKWHFVHLELWITEAELARFVFVRIFVRLCARQCVYFYAQLYWWLFLFVLYVCAHTNTHTHKYAWRCRPTQVARLSLVMPYRYLNGWQLFFIWLLENFPSICRASLRGLQFFFCYRYDVTIRLERPAYLPHNLTLVELLEVGSSDGSICAGRRYEME